MKKGHLLIIAMFLTLLTFGKEVSFEQKLHDVGIQLSQLAERDNAGIYHAEAKKIVSPLIKEALVENDLFSPDSKFRCLLFNKEISRNVPGAFYDELFSLFFKRVKSADENTQKQAAEFCVAFMLDKEIATPGICQTVTSYLAGNLNRKEFYSHPAQKDLLKVFQTQDLFTFDGMKLLETLHLNTDPELLKKRGTIADRFSLDDDSLKSSFGFAALIALARWSNDLYIEKVVHEFSKINSCTEYKLGFLFKMRFLYLIRDGRIVNFLRTELHSEQFCYWGIDRCDQSHAAAIVLYMLLEDFPFAGDIASRYTPEQKQECIRWFDVHKEYRFRKSEFADSIIFLRSYPVGRRTKPAL